MLCLGSRHTNYFLIEPSHKVCLNLEVLFWATPSIPSLSCRRVHGLHPNNHPPCKSQDDFSCFLPPRKPRAWVVTKVCKLVSGLRLPHTHITTAGGWHTTSARPLATGHPDMPTTATSALLSGNKPHNVWVSLQTEILDLRVRNIHT